MLLDSFLDGKESGAGGKKRLDEVRRLRIKREKEAAALKVEEESLVAEEHQSIMSEAVEKQRLQYIQEHPEHLEHFKAGTISTKGYRALQLKLKFTSRKQVEDWLKKLLN